MTYSDYNKKLARTFVKDNDLKLQVLNKESFFELIDFYQLNEKWRSFVNIISTFEGTFEEQVNAFYDKREQIMDDILYSISNGQAYADFNGSKDMPKYDVSFETYEYDEKDNFISIDLKSANMQALHYYNPNITFGYDNWEDLVNNTSYSDKIREYVANSKHIRQIVFGKLNPKRVIAIERYMMHEIHNIILKKGLPIRLVEVNNDELVYTAKIDLDIIAKSNVLGLLANELYEKGFNVRADAYSIKKLRLKNISNGYYTGSFDFKRHFDGNTSVSGIPGYLRGITYCLLRGLDIPKSAKMFDNDNMECMIMDDFELYDKEQKILGTLVK